MSVLGCLRASSAYAHGDATEERGLVARQFCYQSVKKLVLGRPLGGRPYWGGVAFTPRAWPTPAANQHWLVPPRSKAFHGMFWHTYESVRANGTSQLP